MKKIEENYIGRKVKVVDNGRAYTAPEAIGKVLKSKYFSEERLWLPKNNTEAKVIAVGNHRTLRDRVLIIVEDESRERYLINVEGVELLEQPLLVVGTKVIHNTLIYWVEHQDESSRTTFKSSSQEFKAKNEIEISSHCLPCLSKNGIVAIRGKYRDHDLNIDKVELETRSEAEALENRVQEAVREFNEAGGFEKPLPEIKLKGVDPKWKYCAKDENENIFVYDVIPVDGETCWRVTDSLVYNFENTRILEQTQFEEMKKLPWKESLHKIKHI